MEQFSFRVKWFVSMKYLIYYLWPIHLCTQVMTTANHLKIYIYKYMYHSWNLLAGVIIEKNFLSLFFMILTWNLCLFFKFPIWHQISYQSIESSDPSINVPGPRRTVSKLKNETYHMFSNLHPGTTYLISVRARTAKGFGQTALTEITTNISGMSAAVRASVICGGGVKAAVKSWNRSEGGLPVSRLFSVPSPPIANAACRCNSKTLPTVC